MIFSIWYTFIWFDSFEVIMIEFKSCVLHLLVISISLIRSCLIWCYLVSFHFPFSICHKIILFENILTTLVLNSFITYFIITLFELISFVLFRLKCCPMSVLRYTLPLLIVYYSLFRFISFLVMFHLRIKPGSNVTY